MEQSFRTVVDRRRFLGAEEQIVPVPAIFATEDEELTYVDGLRQRIERKINRELDSAEFREAYGFVRARYSEPLAEGEAELAQLILDQLDDDLPRLRTASTDSSISSIALSRASEGEVDDTLDDDLTTRLNDRMAKIETARANRLARLARDTDDTTERMAELQAYVRNQRAARSMRIEDDDEDDDASSDFTSYFVDTYGPPRMKRAQRLVANMYIERLQHDLEENGGRSMTLKDIARYIKEGIRRRVIDDYNSALQYLTEVEDAMALQYRNDVNKLIDEDADDEDEDMADLLETKAKEDEIRKEIRATQSFASIFQQLRSDDEATVRVKQQMVSEFVSEMSKTKKFTKQAVLDFIRSGIDSEEIKDAASATRYLQRQNGHTSASYNKQISWIDLEDFEPDLFSSTRQMDFSDLFVQNVSDTPKIVDVKRKVIEEYLGIIGSRIGASMKKSDMLDYIREGIVRDQITSLEDAITFVKDASSKWNRKDVLMSYDREDWIELDDRKIYSDQALQKRFKNIDDSPPPRLADLLQIEQQKKRDNGTDERPRRQAAEDGPFNILLPATEIRLPFRDRLRSEQKQAIMDCVTSEGRLVVANTGFGKSWIILGVAAKYASQGLPVLLVIRKATKKAFSDMLSEFAQSGSSLPNLLVITHEGLNNIGKEHIDYTSGEVQFDSNAKSAALFRKYLRKDTVILIDECQNFAVRKIGVDGDRPKPSAAYVAMALCGRASKLISRVYLFSATPCSEYAEELKSLLWLVKRQNPPGLTSLSAFNDRLLSSYSIDSFGDVYSEPLPNGDSGITYNWKCLLSFYQVDRTSLAYLRDWARLSFKEVRVPMLREDLETYNRVERNGGWENFGSGPSRKGKQTDEVRGVRRACELSVSKTEKMLELLRYETTRFAAFPQVKPRILIYTYTLQYGQDLIAAINEDEQLQHTNPMYVASDKFNDTNFLAPFVLDTGNSNILFVTKSGITGYDPPALTAIIAMNAFWSPSDRIQLEGRLNRYKKHNFMNDLGLEKVFSVYTVVATKSASEDEAMVDNNVFDDRSKEYREYSFDTRQVAYLNRKAAKLTVGLLDLYRASPQFLTYKQCTQSYVSSKIKKEIEYVNDF